ncbi:MAG: PilT/PilU family type 4a pilus ATPase [Candidatus Auribacterota bacterium]|nr:PilT/PilU family type 4a pilus ATPase [Candidatus Auribacterota bacterium]
MKFDNLLQIMEDRLASDLYLKAGQPPNLRINGEIVPYSEQAPLTEENMEGVARHVLDEKQLHQLHTDREMDVAYSLAGGELRFRINLFYQQGALGAVCRRIKREVQSFSDLNLPVEVMEKLSLEPRGLILIAGAAGSGKTTTLSAMINYINRRKKKHIITIEDPVEFTYIEDKSIINQREVGYDTRSFPVALKYVIRQAPDVIVIGEMRDLETMTSAIMAAEVGHLVISSLHTIDVSQTLERIINFFPAFQHPQIRMQLSFVMKGVVAQRLIARKEGGGRVPACEVLISTPTARKQIMDGKTGELHATMEAGRISGMQTFNQSILKLYEAGKIGYEEAMENSDNPELLELAIKGIFTGTDTFKVK